MIFRSSGDFFPSDLPFTFSFTSAQLEWSQGRHPGLRVKKIAFYLYVLMLVLRNQPFLSMTNLPPLPLKNPAALDTRSADSSWRPSARNAQQSTGL